MKVVVFAGIRNNLQKLTPHFSLSIDLYACFTYNNKQES